MKIFNYSIYLMFLLIIVASCYKDKGNYKYKAINEVSITLDTSYKAKYGSKITVNPEVAASINGGGISDTSKYSYEWSVMNYTPGALGNYSDRSILSDKLVLDTTLSILPNDYLLFLRITDKQTGIQWVSTRSILHVSSLTSEGWLMLAEVDGKSKLEMLSGDGKSYKYYASILDSVNSGLDMSGKPVSVFYSTNIGLLVGDAVKGIYITTSNGTNRIDGFDFKWQPTYNIRYQFLTNIPENFMIDNFATQDEVEILHSATDQNLYYFTSLDAERYGLPINIIASESSKPVKTSKYMACDMDIFGSLYFYDTDNKRFLTRGFFDAGVVPINNRARDTLFKYKTGMDLKYMEYTTYSGGEVYAVLYDANTQKNYIARFSNNQKYYQEVLATDFNLADQIAVDPTYGYMFYSVGGKVYEYDLGLRTSFLMLDKGNSKISLLKYNKFVTTGYIRGSNGFPRLANKLIVASYDPAGKDGENGTMELYDVPQVNGNLVLYESYKNTGKIVSVTYRER